MDSCWVPPASPWYKVNINAAIFSPTNFMGIGFVVCDQEGSVIATLSKYLPLPLGPIEAEAKAMDEAMLFAWDIEIRDTLFEGDSCSLRLGLTSGLHCQHHFRHSINYRSSNLFKFYMCSA